MSTKKPVKAANSWQDGLLRYLRDPASLPASEVYQHDNDTVTIYDGFPKATVHLLLMPRRLVNSVVDLRNDKEDLALLDLLTARAEDITKGLREKHPGLAFRAGLHAVPSMRQLHVHIISQDFVSPSLKNKKHWNSFTTAFFVDLATVRGKLITDGAVKFDTIAYEELLKQPLRCNQCSQSAPNMPKLKAHLEEHLAQS
ncbi:aprataxin-like protein [Sorochytrium milnesiophthora]